MITTPDQIHDPCRTRNLLVTLSGVDEAAAAIADPVRREILLMLRDPHPDVVAILLDNPHITESDVVRIASARPAVPASLARLAAHARWS